MVSMCRSSERWILDGYIHRYLRHLRHTYTNIISRDIGTVCVTMVLLDPNDMYIRYTSGHSATPVCCILHTYDTLLYSYDCCFVAEL